MIVPSRRWFAVAVALGALAPLALVWPAAIAVWIGASVGWIVAVGIDGWRTGNFRWSDLTVEREGLAAFSVGRQLSGRFRWRYPELVRNLWVRETIPALFAPLTDADRTLSLRPGRDLIEERLLTPVARGRSESWRFDFRVAGPWGLCWRQHTRELDWTAIVYPRLKDAALKALPSQSRMRREAGQRQTRRIGEGRLFESLREWVPGDELRSVDWKATARRGKLISRQYEDERRQRVMLVLDAGRMLTAETDGRARLEDAIEAIAQLAYRATGFDDDVGLLVFSDEIDTYVPPLRGRRALKAILDALAVVEGRLVEPDYPKAFGFLASQTKKRALTVVFTDVIDRFASEAMVAQVGGLRPRHLPVAVALRDVALERLASTRPAGVEQAFERAAAEQLLQVRAEALQTMRSKGVVIVDAHPEAAAKAVVEAYLQLKRRSLI